MRLLLVFWLLGLLLRLSQAQVHNNTSLEWTPRSLARLLQQCLSGAEVWQCLGSQTERLLDAASQDNSTWKLSEYLSIEPQERKAEEQQGRQAKGLTCKLLELAQGRALRVRMPRQLTISNAIDEFGNGLGLDQGRKKKDKDKNMAMMGGMIMLATFAQMFLGKVILIAGAAFIMAKIALVIALLGSLKKGSAGQSGSKPEPHVIVTSAGHGGGGGHSHESGWHRSMPTLDYSAMPPPMHNEEESHPGHEQAYQAYEVERIGRRQMMMNEATAKPGFL